MKKETTYKAYKAHGNILTLPHLTQMNWDFKNQLLGATNGTFESYYVYDASGNRVRKVVEKGNVKEERFYVGNYEVYRKTTSGTLNVERTTAHISDDQKPIAMIDNDGTTETIRYQIDNHLGSASLELDQNADIITYEEYHPFGTTSYRSGRSETETSLKRYKYVGKERDEETGLYYYGARYYASWIARFISTDPMAGERSWVNPYNYCQNNPINKTDPTGALDEGDNPPPKGANPELYEDNSTAIKSNNGSKIIGVPAFKDETIKTESYTDYFNLQGAWLGVGLGNNDRKIVLSSSLEQTIKSFTSNNQLVSLNANDSFYTATFDIKEVQAMEKAFKDTETSYNEEGFAVGKKDNQTYIGFGQGTGTSNFSLGRAYSAVARQVLGQQYFKYDAHTHPPVIKYTTQGNLVVGGYKASQGPGKDTDQPNVGQAKVVLGYDVADNLTKITSTERSKAIQNRGKWTHVNYRNFSRMISFYENGNRLPSMKFNDFKNTLNRVKNYSLNSNTTRRNIIN